MPTALVDSRSVDTFMSSTRARALELYRALLRCGRAFNDYNVREYVKRRSGEAFRANRTLENGDDIARALARGAEELAVARRQVAVYELYGGRESPTRWICERAARGGAREADARWVV